MGMYLNSADGWQGANNYFVNQVALGSAFEFGISTGQKVRNGWFAGNFIQGWGGEPGDGSGIVNNGVLSNFNLAPNTISPTAARTVESYSLSIGGAGTLADFITHARAQTIQNWDSRYTAEALVKYISGN